MSWKLLWSCLGDSLEGLLVKLDILGLFSFLLFQESCAFQSDTANTGFGAGSHAGGDGAVHPVPLLLVTASSWARAPKHWRERLGGVGVTNTSCLITQEAGKDWHKGGKADFKSKPSYSLEFWMLLCVPRPPKIIRFTGAAACVDRCFHISTVELRD